MKYLTLREILITILVNYSVTAYIQAEANPFYWEINLRFTQLLFLGLSLFIQIAIKDITKDR